MSLGGHVGSSCTGERFLPSHDLYWLFRLVRLFDEIFSLKLKHDFGCLSLAYLCVWLYKHRTYKIGLFDGCIDWKIAIMGATRRNHNDNVFAGNHRPSNLSFRAGENYSFLGHTSTLKLNCGWQHSNLARFYNISPSVTCLDMSSSFLRTVPMQPDFQGDYCQTFDERH